MGKIGFLVNCKGKAVGFKVIKGTNEDFNSDLVGTISKLQNWEAGKLNNKAVDCRYTLMFKVKGGIIYF